MMAKPLLKQFNDLTEDDLRRHPIWLCVHGVDDGKPWYADTDEVTHRPWDRAFPYDRTDPRRSMVVVRTEFVFADGTAATGLLTPPMRDGRHVTAPSDLQPQVFVAGGSVAFYEPLRRLAERSLGRLRQAFHRDAASIFPVRYAVSSDLVRPVIAGELAGVYYLENGREQVIPTQQVP